jgi:class 3 adenylate cyclase
MRRAGFTARDALLWWGVLGVCAAAYLLHVDALVRGSLAWLPVTLARVQSDTEAPRVAARRSDLPEVQREALAVGTRVGAVGGESLRGRGGLEGALVQYRVIARDGTLRFALAGPDEPARPAELSPVAIPHVWRTSLLALSFLAVGALTWRRAPRRRAARLFFLCAAGYALHWSYFFGGASTPRTALGMAAFGLGVGIAMPFGLRAALAFPDDAARRGVVARLAPWAFVVVGLAAPTWAFGGPLPARLGMPIAVGGSVLFLACVALVLVEQWRRTGPVGRRQIKWVLLGALAAFVPPLLAGTAALARPELAWVYEVSLVSLVLLAAGIFMALARDHLLDVDRLLTTASSTSLLAALLLAGVIVLVPRVAEAAQALVDPAVSQPALSLLAAGGLLAARSRLAPRVERALFPERPALEAGAEALRRELSGCDKPAELFETLGEGLVERLRVQSVVVYGHADTVFAPVFQLGGAVVPAFDADGPLVELLRAVPRVVDVGSVHAWLAPDPTTRSDRAALEAMGSELLVPLLRGSGLEGFVCLGGKPSGQAWSTAELALLQSIADKVTDELHRFDREQVHRAQREMMRRLRRWVPDAVAERAARELEMPSGEREVSVLFVDLRGYTGLAQERGPEATFDLVNRYVETVSAEVRRHGGLVVDFQGDGLMAVFGAPDPLPAKERAAVEAAFALAVGVRALPVDPERPAQGAPELGIGIATGPAFLGSLRAVDRHVWGVLGDTTNLAARLQALAGELGAMLVVDAATHRAAGRAAEALAPRPGVSIRGRRGRTDVFVLTGSAPVAAPSAESPEVSS